MADARILKFDVGSNTDNMLNDVKEKLGASTGIETFRRSLAIADTITDIAKSKNKKLFVQNDDGSLQEILIPGIN